MSDKLSILTLIPNASIQNDKININMLSNTKINNDELNHTDINKDIDFNINDIKKISEKKKEKKKSIYRAQYKNCIFNITRAIKNGDTEVYYYVPLIVLDCYEYDNEECMKYICDNLKKKKCCDTIIVNEKTIFITWQFYL